MADVADLADRADKAHSAHIAGRAGAAGAADPAFRVPFDRAGLQRELQALLGPERVRSYPEDLIAYENDGSVFRALPDLVVFPTSTEEVASVVRVCRRYGAPVIPRGAGTGLAGGTIPVTGGVLLVTAKMNRILHVDLESRIAVVQPGLVNIDLTRAVMGQGYFYAPDPSSQLACSIGGNVANNSGGVHTLSYGVTTNHVLGLTAVLPDGEVVRLGAAAPDAPGLDLVGLFVGSEGTLGIVTEVVVRLMRRREAVRTFLAVFESVRAAGQTVSDIIASGLVPQALEMIDDVTIQAVEPAVGAGIPMDCGAALLIELEGLADGFDAQEAVIRRVCAANGARWVRVAEDPADRDRLWAARKGAFGALGRLAPNYLVQDAVVPRSRLPEVLDEIRAIAARYGLQVANVFHAGDGNLHPNLLFDVRKPGEIQRVLAAGEEIVRLCIDAGGTISGEHGLGIEKNAYLEWLFSPETLDVMKAVKTAFDPERLMNPEKLLPSPVSCSEFTAKMAPEVLAEMGLWV